MTILENVLLFKTTITCIEECAIVGNLLNNHPDIEQWNVDLDDRDFVLRIISPKLTHSQVIDLLKLRGFTCSELI